MTGMMVDLGEIASQDPEPRRSKLIPILEEKLLGVSVDVFIKP